MLVQLRNLTATPSPDDPDEPAYDFLKTHLMISSGACKPDRDLAARTLKRARALLARRLKRRGVVLTLAALLLRPHRARQDPLTWLVNFALGWFFWLFNRGFDKSTTGYVWLVTQALRLSAPVLLLYAGLLGLTYWAFLAAPTGFVS